jgi:hypothetical protein
MFVKLRLPLLILFTIIAIGLFCKYHVDNEHLYQWSQQCLSEDDLPSRKTIKLLALIQQDIVDRQNVSSFIAPIFSLLRPTARQVIESGGYCAEKSRLLIVGLHLNNIHASKVALYDDNKIPQHAVVEVDIENNARMVVDPSYGLYFPKPDGGYYSLNDLKENEKILKTRIDKLIKLNIDSNRQELLNYPYQMYTYQQPRSINWDKSFAMNLLYRLLRFSIGESVNKIKRPYFAERPALIVLYGVIFLQAVLLVSYLPVFNLRIAKKIPNSDQ